MFGLFGDKKAKLERHYNKLAEEAYKLSHTTRQQSDFKQAEAAEVLGALFDSGKTNSDYPLMFAVLIALALLGIVLYYIVVALEKIFAGWAERAPG